MIYHQDVWENDHYLKIFDKNGHFVGSMTRGGNLQHVQLAWMYWFGEEQSCKQRYLPNIEDLLTIPSYHGLSNLLCSMYFNQFFASDVLTASVVFANGFCLSSDAAVHGEQYI